MPEVIIIGTGFSGLGMAIQLKRQGRNDFVLLEKADDIGGTWRDNSYPGCACDVPSHMYSYSFEPKADWSRAYSRQPEIWDYLKELTEKYGLREHIRFGEEVTSAKWGDNEWVVGTSKGEYRGQFLVAGVGALHIPNIPQLPGIERFQGHSFHSATWDHEYDLHGKRVAVVGTGASAIQFVPEIVGEVSELHLYQRTPPWVLPRGNGRIKESTQRLFERVPLVRKAYRNAVYWTAESLAVGFNGHPGILKVGEYFGKRHIAKQIADPELRRKVTPDYTLGCKRVLGSNKYYRALTSDHVDVITDGIHEVREHSIVTSDGVEREVDAIIYATGFHVTDSFDYLDIKGRDDVDLATRWRDEGIQTHLGITVNGFPNAFFLLGPNTGLGHNSVVFMIEAQIRYALDAMRMVRRSRAEAFEVRPSVQASFNEEIQRKLASGVWSTGGCTSWYLDSKGVNRTIWPGFTWQYWLRTRKVDTGDFELTGSRARKLTGVA
ncbi:Predicted flavoprotein CzcO associated with the cation diffusion facilitator CzcD [Amycolatopsis xylanica]|uniref:Predicted flavoprotein CzcO associated with the cation diffusion facilitator CzcD n=1 Tax=Amycolatopsis xylanica TaxID=589385 RepID=A0A1H3SQY5_9PSEU|nr:NAD(P)/FAD-dependent oxidoreductase [Amycolatopsis xylanica]SDZ40364.1 Predicted flavoprotein CzcO associated with the cation diffusion facilitator CzcD [Amycolatopsis xylanica]